MIHIYSLVLKGQRHPCFMNIMHHSLELQNRFQNSQAKFIQLRVQINVSDTIKSTLRTQIQAWTFKVTLFKINQHLLNSFEDRIPNEMLILNLWPHHNVEYLIHAQLSAAGGRVHSTDTHSTKPLQLNRVETAQQGLLGHRHHREPRAITPRWFSASPPACQPQGNAARSAWFGRWVGCVLIISLTLNYFPCCSLGILG